jgi:glycine cleavage system H protein
MDITTEFTIENEIYSIPIDRFYDRGSHMWAQFDPAKNQVTIGIDVLGLTALGDLAYVTLAPIGTSVVRGKSFGTLEAAKMTGNLSSPISGTILARNESTIKNPALINQDPYEKGWLVVLQPTNWQDEAAQLISGEDLPAWVQAELVRYRQQGWID